MKLFLLTQTENLAYDTYDSCVVCAENGNQAKKIHPCTYETGEWWKEKDIWLRSWASNPKEVVCKYIGEAHESIKKRVVISSFNAG